MEVKGLGERKKRIRKTEEGERKRQEKLQGPWHLGKRGRKEFYTLISSP
jgi:hypothetical protein